jgi:hypothetical protein
MDLRPTLDSEPPGLLWPEVKGQAGSLARVRGHPLHSAGGHRGSSQGRRWSPSAGSHAASHRDGQPSETSALAEQRAEASPRSRTDLTRDIRGMILLGELSLDANDAGSTVDIVNLKTIRDGSRAGLSSGLIRCGSRTSAEDRARAQLQVIDHADLPRTHTHRLGKRVGHSSRSRLEPPPDRTRAIPCPVQVVTGKFHDPEYTRNDLGRP